MSEAVFAVNGVEYRWSDDNITSSEYAMGATSAYMAFNGVLPDAFIEAQVKQYEKALIEAGKYSEKLVKEYENKLGALVGKRINAIFTVAGGVITGVFDKNMNPDKSLDEIIAPIAIDVAVGNVGRAIGMWAGGVVGTIFGPVGTPVGMAVGAALGTAVASGLSSLHSDDFYKTLKTVIVDTYNMVLEYDKDGTHYKFTNDELSLTCPDGSTNPFAFVDNKATIVPKEFHCNRVSYIGKNSLDEFIIDFKTKNIEIKTDNDNALKAGIQKALNQDIVVETLTLNNHTYNIKELSNLQILNALDSIPKVSFLLSNILIKVGEEIDLGSKGIYKIKSGDTLSTIAQDNNMTTKELVKLNTWLIDEGRVKFLQDKVLVQGNLANLNETNHTLIGDSNAENILIDANGGDNEFIGGSKADKMESKGKGYDIYHANGGDEITDNDGKGEVWYNSNQLLSATKDNNKNDKYFYDDNGGYYEITSKGLKYTDINGETNIKFANLNLLVA